MSDMSTMARLAQLRKQKEDESKKSTSVKVDEPVALAVKSVEPVEPENKPKEVEIIQEEDERDEVIDTSNTSTAIFDDDLEENDEEINNDKLVIEKNKAHETKQVEIFQKNDSEMELEFGGSSTTSHEAAVELIDFKKEFPSVFNLYQTNTRGKSVIKEIPRSMIEFIREMYGVPSNYKNTDVIQAYIIAQTGFYFPDSSATSIAIAKAITKNDTMLAMKRQNEIMNTKISDLQSQIEILQFISGLSASYSLGFLRGDFNSIIPSDADFIDDGLLEFLGEVRSQVMAKIKNEKSRTIR